jgi:hypothetical protein
VTFESITREGTPSPSRSQVPSIARNTIREELANRQYEARRSLERTTKHKARVLDERQKLLQAHYASAIPQDLLASEMQRFTRELALVDSEVKAAKAGMGDIEQTLDRALTAAGTCFQAYAQAAEPIRRQMNQGFFEKLYIREDGSVERAELTEPFRPLLDLGQVVHSVPQPTGYTTSEQVRVADVVLCGEGDDLAALTMRTQQNTDRCMQSVGGVKDNYLVGNTGIEPVTSAL